MSIKVQFRAAPVWPLDTRELEIGEAYEDRQGNIAIPQEKPDSTGGRHGVLISRNGAVRISGAYLPHLWANYRPVDLSITVLSAGS